MPDVIRRQGNSFPESRFGSRAGSCGRHVRARTSRCARLWVPPAARRLPRRPAGIGHRRVGPALASSGTAVCGARRSSRAAFPRKRVGTIVGVRTQVAPLRGRAAGPVGVEPAPPRSGAPCGAPLMLSIVRGRADVGAEARPGVVGAVRPRAACGPGLDVATLPRRGVGTGGRGRVRPAV